ncbi:MAG: hypothetical protein AAF721_02615 [Myxococcota bacterium]
MESANYSVVLGAGAEPTTLLEDLGAVRAIGRAGARWVLRDPTYWIDVLVLNRGEAPQTVASVRVALCNPPEVEPALRRVLHALLTAGPTGVHDAQTGRRYVRLDEDVWGELLEAYRRKRARFQDHFGTREMPVSGDDVFEALRRLTKP